VRQVGVLPKAICHIAALPVEFPPESFDCGRVVPGGVDELIAGGWQVAGVAGGSVRLFSDDVLPLLLVAGGPADAVGVQVKRLALELTVEMRDAAVAR